MEKKEVLIIGNKPYVNFRFDNIIDKFDTNIRCNFGLPHNNNGTKYDKLALSSHGYSNLISRPLARDAFVKLYGRSYEEDFLGYYYDSFVKDHRQKYKEIFHANFRTAKYNDMLSRFGCPHRFSKIPRTGMTLIFENLLKQNKVFIVFFSLSYDKVRISRDVKETYHGNETVHSIENETNILMWMHKEGVLDATLCMLKDERAPTLICKDLEPSQFILNLLEEELGEIRREKD